MTDQQPIVIDASAELQIVAIERDTLRNAALIAENDRQRLLRQTNWQQQEIDKAKAEIESLTAKCAELTAVVDGLAAKPVEPDKPRGK